MSDPEPIYKQLTSGNLAALRADEALLNHATPSLNAAQNDIEEAAGVPVWTGSPANAYSARVLGLIYGVANNRVILARVEAALDGAGQAYHWVETAAGVVISLWRNRPAGMPSVVEDLYGWMCTKALQGIGTSYNSKLEVLRAALDGEEVDLEALDADVRKWVEQGIEKTGDWHVDSSGLGPLIPNLITTTGDDRGLIPQGASYDPTGNSLLQAYYRHDGGPPVLSLIDQVTGKELTEVDLGGYGGDHEKAPGHAGGVAVNGDTVYVTDHGTVYQYSLKDIRSANPGDPIPQSTKPRNLDPPGGSYATFKDGYLYAGDFEKDVMYVYTRNLHGDWVKVDQVDTPNDVQGVAVREGEYVFSTSHGRDNGSALIVQDRDYEGDPDDLDKYHLPNMSQSVMEVDGQLIVTYESGAEDYLNPTGSQSAEDMWASKYMTTTPLGELGLEPEFEVEPATLRSASRDLEDPAQALTKQHNIVTGIQVNGSDFAQVPAAPGLAQAITKHLTYSGTSLKFGSKAVTQLSESLWNSAGDYDGVDQAVQAGFKKLRA